MESNSDPLAGKLVLTVSTFAAYQVMAHRTAGEMTHHERVCMASMGLAGEAGEVVDELKKVHFHAKPFDRDKLVRELGDVLWYLAELATAHGIALGAVAEANIAKLRARHGDGGFKPHAEQDRSSEVRTAVDTQAGPDACAAKFDNADLNHGGQESHFFDDWPPWWK